MLRTWRHGHSRFETLRRSAGEQRRRCSQRTNAARGRNTRWRAERNSGAHAHAKREKRRVVHRHFCAVCGVSVPCEGLRTENDDGWPTVICAVYHLPNGETNPHTLCAECEREERDELDGD